MLSIQNRHSVISVFVKAVFAYLIYSSLMSYICYIMFYVLPFLVIFMESFVGWIGVFVFCMSRARKYTDSDENNLQ